MSLYSDAFLEFNACSSSTAPFSTPTFVCKVNNIWQNELELKEEAVEELGLLNKVLTVKEKNADKELKKSGIELNLKFFF